MKPAFIFIDLLNDFFREPPLSEQRGSLVSSVNELSSNARSSSFPIIWVRQEFEEDLSDAFLSMRDDDISITIKGTEGCQVLSDLEQSESDIEIVKKRYSAFFNTDLDDILKSRSCSHLIMGGVNTHACIRTAAVDAYQRDYRVIIATDCTSSYDDEYHRVSMRYLTQSIGKPMKNSEIMQFLTMERVA